MHAYQFRRRAMRGDASASIEIDLNGPEWLAILQQRAHNKYSWYDSLQSLRLLH